LIFENNSTRYGGSAKFITWITQGEFPTSGEGTTCIADFYFDFGLIGVILGMFLFGYLIRYCELVMYNTILPSFFVHALLVVYLMNGIYIGRSSVLIHLKTVIWVLLVLLLNKYLLNKKSSR
jgi:oligosaccharide repeat unit polymerase